MELMEVGDDPDLPAGILTTLAAGTAASTRRTYGFAVRQWLAYCAARRWSPTAQPSVAGQRTYVLHVLCYLQEQLELGRAASTIAKTVAALKWHADRTDPATADVMRRSAEIRRFLAGVSRLRSDATVRRARALTTAELRAIHRALSGPGSLEQRNRALIAMGIATALRASTLAALTLADVETAQDGALLVRVRRSKTDQVGIGTTIAVLPSLNLEIDPVSATCRWIASLTADLPAPIEPATTPLFPRVRGGRVQPVHLAAPSDVITDVIRSAVIRAGIADAASASSFSSHTLRTSFVTMSAQAGVSEARIAAVTGHKNLQVLRSYDRSSPRLLAQTAYLDAAVPG